MAELAALSSILSLTCWPMRGLLGLRTFFADIVLCDRMFMTGVELRCGGFYFRSRGGPVPSL